MKPINPPVHGSEAASPPPKRKMTSPPLPGKRPAAEPSPSVVKPVKQTPNAGPPGTKTSVLGLLIFLCGLCVLSRPIPVSAAISPPLPGTISTAYTNRLLASLTNSTTTNRLTYWTGSSFTNAATGWNIVSNSAAARWQWRNVDTVLATNSLNRPYAGTWRSNAVGAGVFGYSIREPARSSQVMVDAAGVLIHPASFWEANAANIGTNAGGGTSGALTNNESRNITLEGSVDVNDTLTVDALTAPIAALGTLAATTVNAAMMNAHYSGDIGATTNTHNPYVQLHWPKPIIAWDTWGTYSSSLEDHAYSNIVERWVTNLAGTLNSNGLASTLDAFIYIDDGWQEETRDGNGNLQTRTSIFSMGISNVIRVCHANGVKVSLYSSFATNTCGNNAGSPTNVLYRDIHQMMTMGADGCFFDTCENIIAQNPDRLRLAIRIANQAVRDFHALCYSTQGVIRPFLITQTTGNGAQTPGEQIIADASLDGANALAWNWGDQAEGFRASVIKAKESLKYLGPFIKPGGPYPDAARMYSGQFLGVASDWARHLPFLAMTCQQARFGAGDQRVGTWTNAAYAGGAGEGYEHYEMTNIFVRFLTPELMSVWRDPLVRPAKIIRTNDLCEVWSRPLINGDTALLVFNLAATNFTQTLSVRDFSGTSNSYYSARAVMWGTNAATFQNALNVTVGSSNCVLLRISPFTEPGEQVKSWQEVNVTGTGTTKQTTTAQIGDARWSGGNDGLYQSAANQSFFFNLPTPWWATQAVVRLNCSSAYTGAAVAWTNNIDHYTYTATSRVTQNGTPVGVVVPDGQSTWLTLTIPLVKTNAPREIVVSCLASTNASARLIVGGVHFKFYGSE